MDVDNDTIVAISTPPGEGGIGIIRLSGSDSLNICSQIFVPSTYLKKYEVGKKISFVPVSKKLYYGFIFDEEGKKVDEVLFSYMKAPFTYTREDIVEINAHGGIVCLNNILNLILKKGARLAEPGEFTKRAFINGRIDLVQAESVLSLIRAKTEKGLRAAMHGLEGKLSGEVKRLRHELALILSDIEVDVDFAHEDLDLDVGSVNDIRQRLININNSMARLLKKRKQGKILQDGLKTVILGKPNVGKSSLYNYLLREERAIVTEIPGTTRDLLIEYVNLKGVPLKLTDTAGFRKEGDKVEKIGMQYSQKAVEDADLLLFMLDASTGVTDEDRWIYNKFNFKEDQRIIIILNKIDLANQVMENEIGDIFPCDKVVEISLLSGDGLEELEGIIVEMFFSGDLYGEEGVLVLEARQGELIKKAAAHIKDALNALNNGMPLDIISIDLRGALDSLGEITGENLDDDVLGIIFSRFCIGK
ncbi:MAG TPA: tRNA uridine-5-carboxymethylaminomethyl(34) synthesis GTPase MnmE [Firmicutes bacterium]|nr:tRNA uridine-5-carboxymethylaminomethyl(34) synthesis GTPase MnmE [Bacillota bacterium]